jgi:hypothetical protein
MIKQSIRLVSLLSLIAATSACTSSGTGPEARKDKGAAPPTGLDAAHAAYLEGDYLALGERVRDVLLDPSASELAKENAYELLDKAYEATSGRMPSAFKLAEPFEGGFQYGYIRTLGPHGPRYRAFSRFPVRDASHVSGFTLRHLPDEIVFDKKSGKGRLKIKHDTPGYEDFNIDSGWMDTLPADGVFTIRIELDDGTATEGWFIVHALAATASPELEAPVTSQSFSEPNPLIRWAPFRSPQYAAFERRTLSVYVSHEGDDAMAWDYWTWDPGDLGQVRIGKHPGASTTTLAPGDYWLSLGCGEERRFGPVRLVRSGRTDVPFHVVR